MPAPEDENHDDQAPPEPVAGDGDEAGAVDWDDQVGAWNLDSTPVEEPTRPGQVSPPPPDSEGLVVDAVEHEVSSTEPLPALPSAALAEEENLADLSEELEIDEDLGETVGLPVGVTPQAALPREQESSSVLIIPDVEELAAAARPAALVTPPPADGSPTGEGEDEITAPVRRTGRTLVDDGLPDLSGLFNDPTPVSAPPAAAWLGEEEAPPPRAGTGGPFDEELPSEPPAGLDLGLPAVTWVWSPQAVAEELPVGAFEAGPAETEAWSAQLALALEELAAREAAGAGGADLATTALWAARAAERAGHGDALPLYQRALDLDPGGPASAAARRGQLRLLLAEGRAAEAAERLADLAAVGGREARSYGWLWALAGAGGEAAGGTMEDELPGPVLRAEAAFRAGDRAEAGVALARLARQLPGEAARHVQELAAVLHETSADGAARADRLRERAGAGARVARGLAALRAAARAPAGARAGSLEEAAAALDEGVLRAALRRWPGRTTGPGPAPGSLDQGGSHAPWWPLPEVLDHVSSGAAAADDPILRLDEVPADAVSLLARRLAAPLAASRAGEALVLLEQALRRAGGEDPLVAFALEGLLASGGEAQSGLDPLAAHQLLAASDPSRRPQALQARAQLLLRTVGADAEDRDAALQALAEAAALAPEAGYWALSWQQRRDGRTEAAAETLLQAASAWTSESEAGQVAAMARVLRDRAAELDAAARPDRLLERLPARSFPAEIADDPRVLARELLARAGTPGELAELWKSAATGGSGLRVLEAAGWMIEAGRPDQALSWLLDASPGDDSGPALALALRRLVRLADDPATQVTVLSDLLGAPSDEGHLAPVLAVSEDLDAALDAALDVGPGEPGAGPPLAERPAGENEALTGGSPRPRPLPPDERAELAMLRAEALALAGRRREAASGFRALLAGPLAGDADLALRRILWTLRDGEALEGLWRDEQDAQSGAGRARGSAAARVEKARVMRDLRADQAAAASELREALSEDPDQRVARIMLVGGAATSPAELGPMLEALARELPSAAVSLFFLAALVADGQGDGEAARRHLRAAVERAGRALPLAVARRYVAVEENQTPPEPQLAEALEREAQRIADTPNADRRLATALLLRAAELEEANGQAVRAEELLRRALAVEPDHLPVLLHLRRLALARGDVGQVSELLAREGEAVRGPRRLAALHAAAALALKHLGDPLRSRALLERALELEPGDAEAFTWLRRLLEQENDPVAVAGLLARRASALPAAEAVLLRLERVDLLLGPGGDQAGARAELLALLAEDPENVAALRRLALLELAHGNHAAAASLSIRQARYERDPQVLLDCFLRIGELHQQHLPDPRIAIGAFERVLRIDPDRQEALQALSELYVGQGETRKALAVTERLAEHQADPAQRGPFLLRLGALWEEAGDMRRAGVMLRRAVDEAPRDLRAVGELARFHERHRELGARNVLLDGSLALLREDLRASPGDLGTLRTMIPLLRWRERKACATAGAQLLATYSIDPAEKAEAASWAVAPSRARRLVALTSPELDTRALPPGLPSGLRHLLRVLGPILHRASKPDLRRWEAGRGTRLARGTPLRDALDALAADLGVREIDMYLSPSQPHALAVEPGVPASVIVGAQLATLGPGAIRFAAGEVARLVETHFDLLLDNGPMHAAALLAALVRHFLPEFRPPFIDPAALSAADARVGRALARVPRAELAPFASEIAGAFSPDRLFVDLEEAGARVGLLASGDLGAALSVIAARAGRPNAPLPAVMEIPVAARLVDFALSEDYEHLVQAFD